MKVCGVRSGCGAANVRNWNRSDCSVGQPATRRPAGVAGSIESNHRGAEPGGGAGSGEVPRGSATGDPSRCRSIHCNGVCADHRESGTLFVWEAGGQLTRSGPAGGPQQESAAGTNRRCWWKKSPRARLIAIDIESWATDAQFIVASCESHDCDLLKPGM